MLVLKILGVLTIALIVFLAFTVFHEYCSQAYKRSIFSIPRLISLGIGIVGLYAGAYVYYLAMEHSGDKLNAIIIASVSVGIIMGVFIQNIRHTSIIVGVVGSTMQTLIVGICLPILMLVGVVWCVMSIWTVAARVKDNRPNHIIYQQQYRS